MSETAFDRAFQRFRDQCSQEEQKFLRTCPPDVTYDEIEEMLDDRQRKLDKYLKRGFQRVLSALGDYNDVISQFVSVQPLPLAIIWGALKIVIESASRSQKIFETMKTEFHGLQQTLQILSDIEKLYPASEKTQELVVQSYVNILRFLNRVRKECDRSIGNVVKRSLTSESTRQLQDILKDLQSTIRALDDRSRLEEIRYQRAENMRANEEREEARQERAAQSDWRMRQENMELHNQLRKYLYIHLEEANRARHETHVEEKSSGTCDWILSDDTFVSWRREAKPPVLCLLGPAGYGKSVLTSFIIQEIEKQHAVAYYFCQRSEPCEGVLKLLRLFALQLFEFYFKPGDPVDDDLAHQILHSHNTEQTQLLIGQLLKALGPIFFFIDGLDELKGEAQKHVSSVIRFLVSQTPHGARVWCSFRSHARPIEIYETQLKSCQHSLLDIQGHTHGDVESYLRSQFEVLHKRLESDNSDSGFSDDDKLLLVFSEQAAQTKADGSFLWARMVTRDFAGDERLISPAEVFQHIMKYRPDELYDLYHSIFQQIRPNDRRFASKVISVVAFSKRHLRVDELREIVNHITARGKKKEPNTEYDQLPLATYISRFSALIRIDRSAGDQESDGRCRLVHSSVGEFLELTPTVLGEESSCRVCPDIMAHACLTYLSQPVFSKLLQKKPVSENSFIWVDADGRSMDHHCFAVYAAKYWSTQLEHIKPDDYLKRVEAFITSPNFATCIQMQTLWVNGRFLTYTVEYTRGNTLGNIRIIPYWLIRPPSTLQKARPVVSRFWKDHILLLHDWQELLTCFSCEGVSCPLVGYRGEIDRIWWSSVRSADTFMSAFPSRYYTFNLAKESPNEMLKGERHESVCVVNDGVKILDLKSWNHKDGCLTFICEHWKLDCDPTTIVLVKSQTIATDEASTNWCSYLSRSYASQTVDLRPTQFNDDATFLRIGAQVFTLDASKDYIPFEARSSHSVQGSSLDYMEDFSGRGKFIVSGTRSRSSVQDRSVLEWLGDDLARLELFACGLKPSDLTNDSDIQDSSDDSETDDDKAIESWSEASTEYDTVLQLEECSEEEKNEAESDQDSASENQDTSDSKSASDDAESALSEESHSSSSVSPSSSRPYTPVFMMFSDDSDDEELYWAQEVDMHMSSALARTKKAKHPPPKMEILVTVIDYCTESPTTVFKFRRPLNFMLYSSPPAIHPTSSLIVYPLDMGDILFADFAGNTFFIRKLSPSSASSRYLSVQPHFSPCGGFLHVATIEASVINQSPARRDKSKQSTVPDADEDQRKLGLTVLLFTYILSKRNLSRAPPSLLHRVKIDIGSHVIVGLSRLPATFTWTPSHLFVMKRAIDLSVFKVALFPEEAAQNVVLVPKKKVFLPLSTMEREVYYHPGSKDQDALIFMGSEILSDDHVLVSSKENDEMSEGTKVSMSTHRNKIALRGMLAPPIGCALSDDDIGGWAQAQDIAIPKSHGVGKLDLRREKFDPEDDCHVETFGI